MSLAGDDPVAAIRMVEQMPLGRDREQMLTVIAASYGRLDADAALAWAQSLSPPSSAVMANVLTGLARKDPARAIELAFQATPADQQRLLQQFVMNSLLSAEQTAEVANRLLATPGRGPALQQLTQLWAQRQPRDAVSWLLANGAQAPAAAVGQAAMSLARTDPSAAIGYLDTVPRELRARWISAVADGYAQADPRAAASWIAAAPRRSRLRRGRRRDRRQNRRGGRCRRGRATARIDRSRASAGCAGERATDRDVWARAGSGGGGSLGARAPTRRCRDRPRRPPSRINGWRATPRRCATGRSACRPARRATPRSCSCWAQRQARRRPTRQCSTRSRAPTRGERGVNQAVRVIMQTRPGRGTRARRSLHHGPRGRAKPRSGSSSKAARHPRRCHIAPVARRSAPAAQRPDTIARLGISGVLTRCDALWQRCSASALLANVALAQPSRQQREAAARGGRGTHHGRDAARARSPPIG